MRRSFGADSEDIYQEYMLRMDKEEERQQVHMHVPESIAMEDVVQVGDQQIIGTADEINVIGADFR